MNNYITTFFQNIKFADLVDIAIITTFIYLMLVWLKKARARFIFIGMIIMGSIYIIARLFGLYLTTIALQAFFAAALFMILIIFQDDLRHFFERIAIFGVARRHRAQSSFGQNIEILSSALANLSRKQMGALVVVRGIDPLDRHLEAGINLDGLMSQVLIESIFDRHVPSHDGAVVVEGGRITKLGCYLPLSTNIKEVGRLGTRHAAALGLTERADALCLVVSEEQGTISVAEGGRIRHLKDLTHLHNVLQDFYNKKFPDKKRIGLASFLTKDLSEKALAVILACSLWLVFGHRTETVRRDFVVPIEYRNLSSESIIREPKTKEVTVTLSGSDQAFSLLKPRELKLSLDMSFIRDGENKFVFTKDLIKNAAGLSVVNIDPDEILLNAYRMVPINVPVELKTRGRSPWNVTIRDMRVEPKEVSVIAPSTLQRDKLAIVAEGVDLSQITDTTTIIPKLVVPPDVRFPGDKRPEVKVIVEVEKR